MLLSKQVCRHSTNEISLQLLSHPVTMATSSSEKNWIFKFKGPKRQTTEKCLINMKNDNQKESIKFNAELYNRE